MTVHHDQMTVGRDHMTVSDQTTVGMNQAAVVHYYKTIGLGQRILLFKSDCGHDQMTMPHSMVKVASFCQIEIFPTLVIWCFSSYLTSIMTKMDTNNWLFYKIKYFWSIFSKFPLFLKIGKKKSYFFFKTRQLQEATIHT